MSLLLMVGCEQHEKNLNNILKNPNGETQDLSNPTEHTQPLENRSEDEADQIITQNIRQYLMADDGLSTNAKNIKIITINRMVTLRGPVVNSHEKEIIERKVSQVKGVEKIDNFIEVKRTR